MIRKKRMQLLGTGTKLMIRPNGGTIKTSSQSLIRYGAKTAYFVAAMIVLTPLFAASQNIITDQTVGDAVEDELIADQAVTGNRIDVETREGIVTLRGTVNNILAKERAADLARTVKGVRSVINRIEVDPPETRDPIQIENDITTALALDPATEAFEIEAAVNEDGLVTLTGEAESWQERELAAALAKNIRGVTEIDNQIDVDYEANRSDMEIRAEIEQTLEWNKWVDNALIDVRADGGEVVLSGVVGSAAEKTEATAAAWVAGVESVDNSQLDVKRWARDEDLRDDKYAAKSDNEIHDAIKDALIYDPRVDSTGVRIDVSGGIATLRGSVDHLRANRAAEQIARDTVGVLSVENRLRVRPATHYGDPLIEDNIQSAMERDPYLERNEITAEVINGTAYLYGTVDTYFEKGQADDVVSRVAGVTGVNNNLNVRDKFDPYTESPYIGYWGYYPYDWYDYQPGRTMEPDAEIADGIRDELWWSPYVDSDEVNVSVENGIATLSGTVDTWSEYRAARENAFEGGASWVNNNLEVE